MMLRLIALLPLVFLLLAMGCAASRGTSRGWHADPQIVKRLSDHLPGVNFDEAKVGPYTLPDPLRARDRSTIRSVAQREPRRVELLEQFTSQMYGRIPNVAVDIRYEVLAEDASALNGAATRRLVAIHVGREDLHHVFELTVYEPNRVRKPAPLLLFIDNRGITTTHPATSSPHGDRDEFWPVEQLIARGYATASFYTWDVAPDDPKRFRRGVIRVFEGEPTTRPADAWGAIAAWSWAASRSLDYLQTDPRIDAKRAAIIGHSRGGKTALWTAAQDQRFSIAYANASGCSGSALARRRFGETVRLINEKFPHWFCPNYKNYNDRESDLPFDQHELVSLIAPRAVYFAAMTEDLWADPRGSFLTLSQASAVYSLYKIKPFPADPMPPIGQQLIAGDRGWHMHEGKHDLTPFDWMKFCDFADSVWQSR